MKKVSAGLLMYRRREGALEVLLAHPGGPFWASKDSGSWSIPKGEVAEGEETLEGAKREFLEETGIAVTGPFVALTEQKQPGGKIIHAWAVEGDCDVSTIRSNTFVMEWPPRSGKIKHFPEIDRADWFPMDAARGKILKGQLPFLDQLEDRISHGYKPHDKSW